MKRIGVDLDNTIIDYHGLFHALAVERGLINDTTPADKTAVRDAVRLLPDGETSWRRLQASAYGPEIGRAAIFPGALDFFRACAEKGIPACIISHKTQFATEGTDDLHQAALGFLELQKFFAPDTGITPEDVYFEPTRTAKAKRIAAMECAHFIDDLPEMLLDPDFPAATRSWLFAPDGANHPSLESLPDWHAALTLLEAS